MARVKIVLPEHFIFTTEIKIRITDLNYGGHVGNDTVLSLAQEARMQLLQQYGFSNEGHSKYGVGIIMTDAAVEYKAEIFYGDSVLVKVAATEPGKYGFDLVYQLLSVNTQKELARVKTGILMYDYDLRKIAILPVAFQREIFQK